jgi:hypothetical protein
MLCELRATHNARSWDELVRTKRRFYTGKAVIKKGIFKGVIHIKEEKQNAKR